MPRLAGYQTFCWLAIAFYTLGGAASRSTFLVLGVGLALTAASAALPLIAMRFLIAAKPRA